MRPTQTILFSLNVSQFFSSFFWETRFMPDINSAQGGNVHHGAPWNIQYKYA